MKFNIGKGFGCKEIFGQRILSRIQIVRLSQLTQDMLLIPVDTIRGRPVLAACEQIEDTSVKQLNSSQVWAYLGV